MSGPYVYPEIPQQPYQQAYQPYPPLGYGADRPPVPPKKSSNAGKIVGFIAGGVLIGLLSGTVGGAVGYVVARETLPRATASAAISSTIAQAAPDSPSAQPGSISEIAARVQPAVVQLNVSGSDGEGTGSGFIISADGYIITNNHVAGVAANGGTIDVVFKDGTKVPGKLVGANSDYDLAVVKVDKTGLPTVPLGSSAALKVGDSVIAVGSPLGLQGTVTTGIVSALDRPVTAGEAGGDTSFIDAIQTDAAINPGNSGGPLLNGNGEVIGVNSAIASMGASAGAQAGSIGLGFAIPIDTAKRVATEIMQTGKASTPVIGVSLDPAYTGEGAQVGEVTAGGAAQAAGLQVGDIITAVDGVKVADSTELIVKVRAHAPGDSLTVTVTRNGQTSDVTLTLGSK
jgi:putative serine protease PepD